jgi:hypothetical protein
MVCVGIEYYLRMGLGKPMRTAAVIDVVERLDGGPVKDEFGEKEQKKSRRRACV